MKTLFALVVGLMLGAAAAGVLLYFNPLTEDGAPAPSSTDRVLRYSLPDQVLGLSLGEHALLPAPTPGDGALWEDTIDRTALLGLVLNDVTNQPAAIASRFVAGSKETNLLLRGVVLHDYWLVTLPGEGSFFVTADTNVWPFLKQTLLPVWYFDRPWRGPAEYRPTAGPGLENTAIVTGATGAYAGRAGSAVEQYRVTELDRARGSATAVGELHLHMLEPQIVAEQ
jgi:hypothetical protein